MRVEVPEQPIETPWTKDDDAYEGERRQSWASRFDLSNWGLFVAERGDAVLGGPSSRAYAGDPFIEEVLVR